MRPTAAEMLARPPAIGQGVVAIPRYYAPLRVTDDTLVTVIFDARDVDNPDATG